MMLVYSTVCGNLDYLDPRVTLRQIDGTGTSTFELNMNSSIVTHE